MLDCVEPRVVSFEHTEPVMKLLNPGLARILYWWVQENNLVLYPNLVYDRLQSHAFQMLHTTIIQLPLPVDALQDSTYLFVVPLVAPLLRDEPSGISPGITIIRPVKFLAPELDDMGKSLKKDAFDLLVQLCHPLIEVGVAFQIQLINLVIVSVWWCVGSNCDGKLTAA